MSVSSEEVYAVQTLNEIIQDLQAVESRIRAYERKYGITSADFYALYEQGLLDDEGFEQSTEFSRWASAYTLRQKRETAFESASRSFIRELQKKAAPNPVRLTPNPALAEI